MNGSTDVLEHILDHDSCNPDVRNRLGGDTPLHIAVRQTWKDQPGMRLYLGELLVGGIGGPCPRVPSQIGRADHPVGSLLEAGADQQCVRRLYVALTCSIKNRHNERPGDLLPPWRDNADPESDDEKVRAMLRRVEAESMVASSGDVVEGESLRL